MKVISLKVIPGFIFLIIGISSLFYPTKAIITEVAPDFTLTDIDGDDFTLSDEQGKVLIIDWFATWCEPCEDQLEYLKEIRTKYSPENLTIISISVDPTYDSIDRLKNFRSQKAITWAIFQDTANIQAKYEVFFGIPQLDIITPNGQRDFTHVGVIKTKSLENKINHAMGLETNEEHLEVAMIVTTFFLGILASFSPCLFPLVPSYLSFVLKTEENRMKGLWSGIACTLGIMVVFVLVGVLASQIGSFLIKSYSELTLIMGGILILLGMILILPLQTGILEKINVGRITDRLFDQNRGTISISFLMGLSFALIAAPCAMPIFLSIIIISLGEGIFQAMIQMIVFSIGAGIPFVIIGLAVPELKEKFIQKGIQFKRWTGLISGLLILFVGLDMILPHFFTSYQSILGF